MRRVIILLAAVVVAALAVTTAYGASVHFKKGGTPKCTLSGSGTTVSTTCTGSVAGLGGGDVQIDTIVSGFAVYTCTNQGGNAAPGQNQVLVGPDTSPTTIGAGEIKNGNLTFTTVPNETSAESTVSGAAAGCPNNHWTGTNPQLTVTDITLNFYQGGNLVFSCSTNNPSGLSGTVTLSNCTFA
jgi:hypothetical protein